MQPLILLTENMLFKHIIIIHWITLSTFNERQTNKNDEKEKQRRKLIFNEMQQIIIIRQQMPTNL